MRHKLDRHRTAPVNALRLRLSVNHGYAAYHRPWWYGIAYWEFNHLVAHCYPLGLHWIVRIWHRYNPDQAERNIAAWRRRRAEL